ncbi:MAG: hypothetical protein VKK04_03355, partial [Synechococcales bacterium]|nr:hypothetical protein [Synechococcales bacterium]
METIHSSIELLRNVTFAAVLVLGVASVFKYYLFDRKAQPESISSAQKTTARLTRMMEALRARSRFLILGVAIFVVANAIFYYFVDRAAQAGYIGHNPALETLGPLSQVLLYLGLTAQTLDNMAKRTFFPEVIRWFTVTVCLLSYFVYCLW